MVDHHQADDNGFAFAVGGRGKQATQVENSTDENEKAQAASLGCTQTWDLF
jgi:hypothetical protein